MIRGGSGTRPTDTYPRDGSLVDADRGLPPLPHCRLRLHPLCRTPTHVQSAAQRRRVSRPGGGSGQDTERPARRPTPRNGERQPPPGISPDPSRVIVHRGNARSSSSTPSARASTGATPWPPPAASDHAHDPPDGQAPRLPDRQRSPGRSRRLPPLPSRRPAVEPSVISGDPERLRLPAVETSKPSEVPRSRTHDRQRAPDGQRSRPRSLPTARRPDRQPSNRPGLRGPVTSRH